MGLPPGERRAPLPCGAHSEQEGLGPPWVPGGHTHPHTRTWALSADRPTPGHTTHVHVQIRTHVPVRVPHRMQCARRHAHRCVRAHVCLCEHTRSHAHTDTEVAVAEPPASLRRHPAVLPGLLAPRRQPLPAGESSAAAPPAREAIQGPSGAPGSPALHLECPQPTGPLSATDPGRGETAGRTPG